LPRGRRGQEQAFGRRRDGAVGLAVPTNVAHLGRSGRLFATRDRPRPRARQRGHPRVHSGNPSPRGPCSARSVREPYHHAGVEIGRHLHIRPGPAAYWTCRTPQAGGKDADAERFRPESGCPEQNCHDATGRGRAAARLSRQRCTGRRAASGFPNARGGVSLPGAAGAPVAGGEQTPTPAEMGDRSLGQRALRRHRAAAKGLLLPAPSTGKTCLRSGRIRAAPGWRWAPRRPAPPRHGRAGRSTSAGPVHRLTEPWPEGEGGNPVPTGGMALAHFAALYAAWGPERMEAWLKQLKANEPQI